MRTFRVHPAFKVAVTRQHRTGNDIAGLYRTGNLRPQGARVTDAGGAAIAHEVKADGGQVFQKSGFAVVVRDPRVNPGPGRFSPRVAR